MLLVDLLNLLLVVIYKNLLLELKNTQKAFKTNKSDGCIKKMWLNDGYKL